MCIRDRFRHRDDTRQIQEDGTKGRKHGHMRLFKADTEYIEHGRRLFHYRLSRYKRRSNRQIKRKGSFINEQGDEGADVRDIGKSGIGKGHSFSICFRCV